MASEWRKTPLARVAVITSGRRPSRVVKEAAGDCQIPVIGGGGPSGYTDAALFDGGVLITGRVGTLGKLFALAGPCWPSDNALVVRPHSAETDPRFLRYALQQVIAKAVGMNRGAANPLITQGDLGRLIVGHPSLPDQRAIAHVLGTLDDKIELSRRMSETLEAMAQALFKSWFVDFDPVRAKADGRDPGLPQPLADLFPSRFIDSELGQIPEGWRACCVDDEFDITMGQSPAGSTYNEIGEGLPFYQGRADFGVRFPGRRVFCTAPTRLATPGDTLITVRAPVGDVNMAWEDCAIGRGVAGARHKTGSRSYTYAFMHGLAETFERFEAEGTVFGSINKKDFHAISCVGPPSTIVRAFETVVAPLDSRLELCQSGSRTLAGLRDTLLPRLISGELQMRGKLPPRTDSWL